MGDFVKRSGRWLSVGWFWPLALLALPNCVLQSGGLGPPLAFDPGPEPRTSAIMCDIPQVPAVVPNCANPMDLGYGISMAHAAVALAQSETSVIALDYSQGPGVCSGGPVKTEFFGKFPDGYAVCLNCGKQIPAVYADANAACVAQCIDLLHYHTEGPAPPEGVEAYCQAKAKVSTNFNKDICFDDACDSGGIKSGFFDPRRNPEPVKWVDPFGVATPGNLLTRTAPETGQQPQDYNAGAASAQLIGKGDGWVEFEASENNLGHVVGLSKSCDGCSDSDPSLADIHFGISLSLDGTVRVIEGGTFLTGPEPDGSYGTYLAGDRFRVVVTDNNDQTANVTYYRVNGACAPGTPCSTTLLDTHSGPAPYPFRVDASFRQQNATVANVTLVRLQ